MAELDKWNDDRLAATRALAERIAGDLAVLVAGLRPEPPKPAAYDGIREGQWRLLDETPYRVGRETRPGTREALFHGLKNAYHAWLDAVIIRDPIIPAPPSATAVWAIPRARQKTWDAGYKMWVTAKCDYESHAGFEINAPLAGYPREAGPWRWCEPVAETPAPRPDDKVGRWFVRVTDQTDTIQLTKKDSLGRWQSTPSANGCIGPWEMEAGDGELWLPILDRPDAAVLATRGKRLTGIVHVPEGEEQYVTDDNYTVSSNTISGPSLDIFGGRRWIVADIPQPQPKFPIPTWAETGKHKTRRIVISIGDSRVDVYHDDTQKIPYSAADQLRAGVSSREEDWTACEDPRVALTAALAKEKDHA